LVAALELDALVDVDGLQVRLVLELDDVVASHSIAIAGRRLLVDLQIDVQVQRIVAIRNVAAARAVVVAVSLGVLRLVGVGGRVVGRVVANLAAVVGIAAVADLAAIVGFDATAAVVSGPSRAGRLTPGPTPRPEVGS
jgi:hypothetical protein